MKKHSLIVHLMLIAIGLQFISLLSCTGGVEKNPGDQTGNTPQLSTEETLKIAREAYEFGLPLVLIDISKRQMLNGTEATPPAPLNAFRHRSAFPDASFRDVVRPNADTYYSIAWLDLKAEPMVLSVPDTRGRYYMLPMIDAYSNVFASPGSRTTGTKAGRFLVSGPNWKGTVPDGMQQISAPTNLVWIIGRTQVNSKQDGERVVIPIQRALAITPLSMLGKPFEAKPLPFDSMVPKGSPNDIVRDMPIEDYFNYLNKLMAEFPPQAADSNAVQSFAKIGVAPGVRFSLDQFPTDLQDSLKRIPVQTVETLRDYLARPGKLINGWSEVTTTMGAYGTNYGERARVSFVGLGANLAADAVYPSCYVDADGNKLDGANQYVIHFEKGKTPPAGAFWSLTMYDPEGYMVPNPLNRNAIGDRSNLRQNADGSVDIFIQHASPGKAMESNWLPAPKGPFNLLMRVYWPKEEMLNGTYLIPPVKKAGS